MAKLRMKGLALAAGFGLGLWAGAAAAQAPNAKVPVIVTLAEKPDLSGLDGIERGVRRGVLVATLQQHAAEHQPPVLAALTAAGAEDNRPLWAINAIATSVNPAAIEALSHLPGVESVRLDETVSAPATSFSGATATTWNIAMVNAAALWDLGYAGQGMVVANVDTGVDAGHPALSGKWRGGGNSWFDPRGQYDTPHDGMGHGTQTMGLMVAVSGSGAAVGMAPGATWIAAKAFDDSGNAQLSDLHLSYQWLLDPDGDPATDDAPDVVSSSWNLTNQGGCSSEFQPDMELLKLAGIAIAFSAGNYGPSGGSDVSPANNSNNFAVGAVDVNGDVGLFSSRGPSACDGTVFPEVVAPGVEVETTDLSFGGMDLYAFVSGTSFASPHVAGGMALLMQAFPNAGLDRIEAAMRDGARDLGAMDPDNDYGYGLVDIKAAYDLLAAAPGPLDADGDGYAAGIDCDDNNPAVYPGAPETKHDGIDQDCNGYDLTIDIAKAAYDAGKDKLTVQATSALGGGAGLELAGYGPMNWNAKRGVWNITVSSAGGNPGAVTVSGAEGADSAAVTESGGGGGGGATTKGGRKK